VTLIRSAARRCLDRLGHVDADAADTLRGGLARQDYGDAGKPQISWSSAAARAELVAELFADATAIIETCSSIDDPELVEHVALLAVVAAQDVDIVDDSDGPKAQIRHGVAPERVISTVDTDARHGHRSRRDRYDGYKVHVSADIDSDLICAITATTATTHDAAVLDALLDTDPVPVAEVIADTHYGSVATRKTLCGAGVELVAPAPPASSPKGLFSKADFAIDLDAATITCPAGHTMPIPSRTDGKRIQVRFPTSVCSTCLLHDRCTKRVKGRVIEINADEAILAAARAARSTPQFRDRYRERARAERKVAQVKARQSKIPWRGLANAIHWAELRAGALNLDRIGRLGLIT